ncbi:MAG TPA: hypothetical protein VJK00_04455, partial [Steroidobacteraceae bacterium]|nr:hypothetical protein [Steroidobacteraceae bacterium]
MQRFTWVRPGQILLTVAGLFIAGLIPLPSIAQTPTEEQIRIFQSLPPEQQRAILDAIGSQAGSGVLGAPGTTARPDERIEPVPGVDAQAGQEDLEDRTLTGEPRLKPDDTLIVEILPMQWEGQERVLTLRTQMFPQPTSPDRSAVAPQVPRPTPAQASVAPKPPDAVLIERDEAETAKLQRLIDTVRRGNPYRLTRSGTLDLPGLAAIPVAGLTPFEATQRLAVERLLQDFRIRLTLLPLEPALKPFGHDLFTRAPSAFEPI